MQTLMSHPARSLNAPASNDSQHSLQDTLTDNTGNPEQAVTASQAIQWCRDRIAEFTAKLSDTEKTVWQCRVIANVKITSENVGQLLGTSKQYVSQIEAILRDRFNNFARGHDLRASA